MNSVLHLLKEKDRVWLNRDVTEISGQIIHRSTWGTVSKASNEFDYNYVSVLFDFGGPSILVPRDALVIGQKFSTKEMNGPSPYHLKAISKGVFGEFSKIDEEIEELQDAKTQENPLLILCELADLLGAIEGYTMKHHNISLENLHQMTKLTRKAFESGHRS